ncbi:MAG: sortase [Baekduia sp.]|nr:sortase [Baekduia sp.]
MTPLGSRRTGVADLQREVERLTEALQHAEELRRTAERTLADVAQMAAADTADLRARLIVLQAQLAGAPAPPATDAPAAPAGTSPAHPRRRRVKRLLLLAGLIAGAALITDGLLTIFWQEPLTAVQQSRSQSALRDDLRGLQRTLAAAPHVARETSARRMRSQALTLLNARPDGAALGSLSIPKIGLKSVIVESTSHDALTKGPGHYRGTVLPGMDGTVGLAGHRTTYGAPFRHVDRLSVGSQITMNMPYGRFTYKVTGTRITTPSDASALRSHTGIRRLVLTACHPLYSAAQRIVVTARLVSATPV